MSSRIFLPILVLVITISAHAQNKQVAAQPKPLIVAESVYQLDKYGKLWWTVVLKNPNVEYFARRPTVRITARDSAGQVLASKDKTFPEILPGGELAYSDDLDVTTAPSKVEFKPLDSSFEQTDSRLADYARFRFKSVRLLCDNPKLSSCRGHG
jgi:hypothetical protein